jgi:hypothetical protein
MNETVKFVKSRTRLYEDPKIIINASQVDNGTEPHNTK